jgi:hypothetical protein
MPFQRKTHLHNITGEGYKDASPNQEEMILQFIMRVIEFESQHQEAIQIICK